MSESEKVIKWESEHGECLRPEIQLSPTLTFPLSYFHRRTKFFRRVLPGRVIRLFAVIYFPGIGW
jgi:hypothetical protein